MALRSMLTSGSAGTPISHLVEVQQAAQGCTDNGRGARQARLPRNIGLIAHMEASIMQENVLALAVF